MSNNADSLRFPIYIGERRNTGLAIAPMTMINTHESPKLRAIAKVKSIIVISEFPYLTYLSLYGCSLGLGHERTVCNILGVEVAADPGFG